METSGHWLWLQLISRKESLSRRSRTEQCQTKNSLSARNSSTLITLGTYTFLCTMLFPPLGKEVDTALRHTAVCFSFRSFAVASSSLFSLERRGVRLRCECNHLHHQLFCTGSRRRRSNPISSASYPTDDALLEGDSDVTQLPAAGKRNPICR